MFLIKTFLFKETRCILPRLVASYPPYINALVLTNQGKRGKLKLGVYLNQGKYVAQCGINRVQRFIGKFDTENEAHEAYKEAKYEEIKRVATEALKRGEIGKNIYDALLRYKIKEY